MIVVRVLGVLLLLGAVVAGVEQFQMWSTTGRFTALALGQLWYNIDPPSLNLVQAVIERHVWPPLWDPVILTILRWPAWLALGVPGIMLLVMPGSRRHRRRG
jgi:hypothetical protein